MLVKPPIASMCCEIKSKSAQADGSNKNKQIWEPCKTLAFAGNFTKC